MREIGKWQAIVALILLAFLAKLGARQPQDWFGWYHDDTIYFSAARSLAEGRGYRLPSVPGTPPETKYPVLYPWLLSWIWRWRPFFPANVSYAIGLTALFACWFLIASFQLLRSLGLGNASAACIVALCAFQPSFLFLSGAVLSDIPFMALATTAAVMADSAMRPGSRVARAAAAAAVTGLAGGMRAFGLALAAGIVVFAFCRRAFRQGAVFCAIAAPMLVLSLSWPHAKQSLEAAAAGGAGWQQTWLFYTSYGKFWKLCVPTAGVLFAMLGENVRAFLQAPASLCLFPPLGEGSYAGTLLCVTLSLGILAGAVRQARRSEWKPIHFIFVFYSCLTLVWNYTLMDRFLLLFAPLFYSGLWVETEHFISMLRDNFRPGRPRSEKALAAALGLALAAVGARAALEYLHHFRPDSSELKAKQAVLAREKSETYEWIRKNTGPAERFVAYQDVSLYLNTNRQALRPIIFSTEAFYKKDDQVLRRDLAHITDVARHIGARYWLASDDDFQLETGLPLIEQRMAEIKAVLPVLFHSRTNKVQVLDLSCLLHSELEACRVIVPVLCPTTTGS